MLPEKKNGKWEYHQRLVILAVSIGMTDVSDCFHKLRIPESLSRDLAMPLVTAKSELRGANKRWLLIRSG